MKNGFFYIGFVLLLLSFSLDSVHAQRWDPEQRKFVTDDEINAQMSYQDMLRNSRPISVFFELRKNNQPVPLRKSPNSKATILTFIKPGQIVQVVLDIPTLVKRNRAIRNGKGMWLPVDIVEDPSNKNSPVSKAFFYETYESFKGMRLANNNMPVRLLKPRTADRFEVYLMHQTRFVRERGGVKLQYKVRDPRELELAEGLWLPAKNFVRTVNHHFVNQYDCIPITWFTDDLSFTRYLVGEFNLLPKKGKKIKDNLSDTVFLQSKRKQAASLRRDWIKKKVTQLSDEPGGDIMVREELDIGLDLGGKIGYETIDLQQTSDIADVSFVSNNGVAGISGYVPIYLDLEVSFKVDLSYPLDQTFTDNIKTRDLEIEPIYHLTADQLFIFQPDNTNKKPGGFDYLWGLGITYKGMLGREVSIGYDTLLGANFTLIWSYYRLVGQFKFAPLANQFELDMNNKDAELIMGLLLYDNQYYRDFILYVKANHLTFNGKINNSELELLRLSAGISLGF